MKKQDQIQKTGLQVVMENLIDLIPYARNARTHSDAQVAQIAASIREFGFNNPVLIDQDKGIIAGHGRVLAARKLGMIEIPCIRLGHLSDAAKRAFILADNKIAGNAGWDLDALQIELKEILDAVDAESIGFTQDELDDLLEVEDSIKADADDTAKLPKAVQLEPPKEYAVIVCSDHDEWEQLKMVLGLTPVRRGGYREGSPFESVGTQRVVRAEDFFRIIMPTLESTKAAES